MAREHLLKKLHLLLVTRRIPAHLVELRERYPRGRVIREQRGALLVERYESRLEEVRSFA